MAKYGTKMVACPFFDRISGSTIKCCAGSRMAFLTAAGLEHHKGTYCCLHYRHCTLYMARSQEISALERKLR